LGLTDVSFFYKYLLKIKEKRINKSFKKPMYRNFKRRFM
jgi:hypothetical protein